MRWTALLVGLLATSSIGCGDQSGENLSPHSRPMLSTETVLFSELFVGEQEERSLVVSNAGETELRIVSVGWRAREVPVFSVAARPLVIPPGEAVEVPIRFEPQREGDHRATLELIPAAGAPLLVDVLGSAIRGACEIDQEQIDFGVVAAGARVGAELRVENTGTRAWRATVEVLQSARAFALSDSRDAAPREIEVLSVVALPVEFGPVEPGEFNAVVTLSAPTSCGTRSVVLRGRAVDRLVVASTDRLSFGYVDPGMAGRARLTLSNAGATDLTIKSIAIDGADAGAFNLLSLAEGARVPARGELELELAFSPHERVVHDAVLLIDVGEPERSPLEVALVGHGGGPKVALPSASVDYGLVALGTSQARAIVLRNVGSNVPGTEDDNLRLVSGGRARMPIVTDGGAGEFGIEPDIEGYSARGIAAGDGAAVTVRFSPRSTGRKVARVSIWTNDPERPVVSVTLEAYVKELPPCDLEIVPDLVDFGTVLAGEQLERSITVRNRAGWATGRCSVFRIDLGELGDSVFSLVGENGPVELAPGEERVVVIRLDAPDRGTFAGHLELSTSSLGTSEVRIPFTARVLSF